uniref:Odorant receptor n=1 Tax=Phlebotomus papatasi TaxID=29031 RepID=A0A3F2ZED0_PHLPP
MPKGIKDLYQDTVKDINEFGSWAGVDFLLRDVTKPLSRLGSFMFFAVILGIISNIYSMYYFRDNWLDIAFALATFGIIFALLPKIYAVYTINHFAHEIIREINDIISRLVHCQEKCQEMKICLKGFQFIYKVIKIVNLGTAILMFVYTFAVVFYKKERILFVGYILPFLNSKEYPGFEINLFCHMFEAYFCTVIYTTADTFYFGHYFIACRHNFVMAHYVRDFNKLVNENDEITDYKKVDKCLVDLLNEHQSHLKLMSNLTDFTIKQNLCQIIGSMCSIIMNIFVLVKILWISGLAILLAVIAILFLYGAMGSYYLICAEAFQNEIYNCKWYSLPPRTQKALAYVLQMSQKPIQPSVGGFVALDLRVFMKVSIQGH